ncbi:MAG: beta-1,3-glucanase family protein [Rhodocyclales bacterium]|nr:beta-1,3-glucanase family protein [Rhodocyclales bacterium]
MDLKHRRTFLATVCASGLLTACGGGGGGNGTSGGGSGGTCSGTSSAGVTSAVTPLTIDGTLTDLPCGTPVYVYVIGEVKASGTTTQYYFDANGKPHAMTANDNNQPAASYASDLGASGTIGTPGYVNYAQENYPTTWADYSIPVTVGSKTILDLAEINAQNMPGLGTGTAAFSGRIYLSVGTPKLPFTAIDSSQYTAPVTIGGPGQYTLFDWIEFSYDSAGNFNGNTTQVDQFGFPLLLSGTPGGLLQGQYKVKRSDILAAVAQLGADFNVPVSVPPTATTGTYPAGISTLRALSPKAITGQNSYSGALLTYFDNAVQSWYSHWTSPNSVTVTDQASGVFYGTTQTGTLTFTQGSTSFPVAGSSGIPSMDIWQCANSLATGSAAQKNVQKILAAAFNRGNVSNTMTDMNCASGPFYSAVNPAQTFNPWANLFHQVSSNGLAYAFPYDDVCDQNPSIGLTATQSVTIAIGKFFS